MSDLYASLPRRYAVLGNSSEDLARFSQALLSDPLASDQRPTQLLAARAQAARQVTGKERIRTLSYGTLQDNTATPPDRDPLQMSDSVPSRFLVENALELRELLFDPGMLDCTLPKY